MFKNKKLLIVGGTGSFGKAMLVRILKKKINFKEIRIFSRDEKKQDDMRKEFNSKKLKFYIGDVRDLTSLDSATKGVNYIFHAAALKQVPSCEFYPYEAVKTNIIGTNNLLSVAEKNQVERVVCLSTDKAVYPINAMGISKALMEKIIISKSLVPSGKTKYCVTRYGNVIGSRGSVIPMLIEQIKKNKPLTITDKNMTRFMMTMDEALELVLFALANGNNGEIFIKKTPAASLEVLCKSLYKIFQKTKQNIKIIGTRHGEKLHETLMNREERVFSTEKKGFFIIKPDLRDLNYEKYFSKGKKNISAATDYNSFNTNQLKVDQLIKVLKKSNLL